MNHMILSEFIRAFDYTWQDLFWIFIWAVFGFTLWTLFIWIASGKSKREFLMLTVFPSMYNGRVKILQEEIKLLKEERKLIYRENREYKDRIAIVHKTSEDK